MTTTVNLSEQEAADLRDYTEQDDLSSAASSAIREYLRYVKRMKLISLSNEIEMEDNWQELERRELDDAPH
ncbi:MAG: hypothetical protein AB7U20_06935 [Planctomycetaceae bacterium]